MVDQCAVFHVNRRLDLHKMKSDFIYLRSKLEKGALCVDILLRNCKAGTSSIPDWVTASFICV